MWFEEIYPGRPVTPGNKPRKNIIIRPWRWKLPEGTFSLPEGISTARISCSDHLEALVPYSFKGKQLYVCRTCGYVYERKPKGYRRNANYFDHWRVLNHQPYDLRVIDHPGRLNYDFVHSCGGIVRHPIIDAHGKGDPVESTELIARFFTYLLKGIRYYPDFFTNDTEKMRIQVDTERLIISQGKDTGNLANDLFVVYREEKDSLSLEFCFSWEENAFGFTADTNEDDWEDYATRQICTLSYLGPDQSALDHPVRALDDRETGILDIQYNEGYVDRQITEAPFDLEGFYLFERRCIIERIG